MIGECIARQSDSKIWNVHNNNTGRRSELQSHRPDETHIAKSARRRAIPDEWSGAVSLVRAFVQMEATERGIDTAEQQKNKKESR